MAKEYEFQEKIKAPVLGVNLSVEPNELREGFTFNMNNCIVKDGAVEKRKGYTGLLPTVLTVNDTFTVASQEELDAHTPDVGAQWIKRIDTAAGTLHVDPTNNWAETAFSQGNGGYLYTVPTAPALADYTVKVTFKGTPPVQASGRPVGVIGRYVDVNNYYAAGINDEAQGSKTAFLYKKVTGTIAQIGSNATGLTFNAGSILTLEMVGSTLRLLIDGIEILSETDSSLTAIGEGGIVMGNLIDDSAGGVNSSWKYDNFQVIEYFRDANPILNITEYASFTGGNRLLFVTLDKLIEYTGSWVDRSNSILLTGDEDNAIISASVAGLSLDKLYITNGKDKIKETSTGNWADLTTTGFTTLISETLIGHKGHLLLGNTTEDGTAFPYRLRWSKINDPGNWNESNISAGHDDLIDDELNEPILAIKPYKSALLVYKASSIYLTRYDSDNYFVSEMRVDTNGAISPHGMASVLGGDFHLVVTKDNVRLFDGFSFVKPAIGERIKKDLFDNINWSKRNRLFVRSFPNLDRTYIFYPRGSDTVPKDAWCWHWKENAWTSHTFNDGFYSAGLADAEFSNRTILFGLNGDVMKGETGNNDDSVAINGFFETRLRDFAERDPKLALTRKTAYQVELEVSVTDPLVKFGSRENILDSSTYESDTNLRTGKLGMKIHDGKKSGRYLNVHVSDNSTNAGFRVASLLWSLTLRSNR